MTERYLSLDILRGLTVALMIVVNTPGSWSSNYGPLLHAPWHGFTLTDLVFPSFLFVVGNAMSFSMKKLQRQGKGIFLKKTLKRAGIIFLIGLVLAAYPFIRLDEAGEVIPFNFANIRIFGVLQRIALCYAIAAFVIYFFSRKGVLVYILVTLFGYWLVMFLFGERGDPYSLLGNAATRLDLWLIGPDNMYKGEGVAFDPEGILSTFPATINVVLGYAIGKYIQSSGNNYRTVTKLVLIGLFFTVLAYIWDLGFPINKKIWTSSYVLLTVGLSTLLLAILMYIIEVMQRKKWAYFFEVFGRNPLILYVLSGLIIKTMFYIRIDGISLNGWIYQNFFVPYLNGKNASLSYAVCYMLLIWLIGYAMDKRKLYIKV